MVHASVVACELQVASCNELRACSIVAQYNSAGVARGESRNRARTKVARASSGRGRGRGRGRSLCVSAGRQAAQMSGARERR